MHVYIREVCLGFGKNVVLWCDDGIVTNSNYLRLHDWVQRRQFKDRECMQTQYVYKTQTLVAKAYIQSVLFRLSLSIAENYNFVQNLTRKNENAIQSTKQLEQMDIKEAAWQLLNAFYEVREENAKIKELFDRINMANFTTLLDTKQS